MRKIKNALITVYNKEKISEIAATLTKLNITIYSTGGTYEYLRQQNVPAIEIESLTGYPSIFGGRVKTLHPTVMGGILYRRDNEKDIEQADFYKIPPIDLIIVDLYPFEETLQKTDDPAEIIEKIDIGGISLIRAAAKNFNDVLCVPSREYYQDIIDILKNEKGTTTQAQRQAFATKCFKVSSHYDTAIYNYFSGTTALRYGENPHQKANYYGNLHEIFDKLNGKEISYNNLLDIDAAVSLMSDLGPCSFAIIKHNNACGVAQRNTLLEAWNAALAGDPVSAFGGVLICNELIDVATAEEINKLFFEILIAPDFQSEALEVLMSKKNRIILKQKPFALTSKQYRNILNGIIEQDRDISIENIDTLTYPTDKKPSKEELDDLFFANKLVKHTKSNAIVFVKNKQLLASGMGQTSRVDSLQHAIMKAKHFNFDLKGAVMASDAFFPFNDCVELAAEVGISAIIQPGGSIRDNDSIEACNKASISMIFTGVRHFKH
ncbi:MAG: bifunctional phosphoribosylaminoimidazolecarboxamide formyltransferase/IMP cyclohydrolase [Bacteroidales bacterium]|jgi:phosphoribosylaminoimidazolecarboxamide formyltransferase/IMP cyclohydrolase|nr:bifunctional phosphoribosylaminoimidazolecarboxamide formyltransferase/IMP cyclohydrolase [Bacteroidales bacterium]